MSSDSSQRRKQRSEPLFEVQEKKALPKQPQPLADLLDPFADLPAVGPRTTRSRLSELHVPDPDATPASPPTQPLKRQVPPATSSSPASSTEDRIPVRKVQKAQVLPIKNGDSPPDGLTKVPKVQFQVVERADTSAAPVQGTRSSPAHYEHAVAGRSRRRDYDDFAEHEGYAVAQHYWDVPATLARRRPGLLLLLVAVVCGIIVWRWAVATPQTYLSTYNGGRMPASSNVVVTSTQAHNTPPGEHSVLGPPTIDAAAIDTILAAYGSPAAGTGHSWVAIGQRYGIDPAYALAFFIHESSAGTNPGWAGWKSDGSSTHNIGNIICAGYSTCYGRFRDYASWEEGIDDWYKLIGNEYVNGRNISTVEQIVPVYAPSSDNNNVPAYVQAVVGMVDTWRQGVYR